VPVAGRDAGFATPVVRPVPGRILGAAAALVLLLLAIGPRPSVDPPARGPRLPGDLSEYLASSESQFADLRAGADKRIVWADPARRHRTPLSVVYLHGFSASRQETYPLADRLAAKLGANLFYTRLTGHGRSPRAMGEASAEAWLDDALEALAIGRRIGERVILVGGSTGATLAIWVATRDDADALHALVLFAPNFGPANRAAEILLWPWGEALARLLIGDYRTWTPANAQQARYWTTRYPVGALTEMMALVELVREQDLGRVDQPVLVLYSEGDRVVDVDAIKRHYARFGSEHKRLVAVESADPAQHVLAGDALSPSTTDAVVSRILAFLGEIATGGASAQAAARLRSSQAPTRETTSSTTSERMP